MKRIACLILSLALVMSISGTAFAANEPQNVPMVAYGYDVYAAEITESATVDGKEYTFRYQYDADNNQVTSITDETNHTTDVLVYDRSNGIFYLNGEIAATITTIIQPHASYKYEGPDGWTHFASINSYVSWEEGLTMIAVATILSEVLGFIGGPAALVQFAADDLADFYELATCGTITGDVYTFSSMIAINYLYIWDLTTESGEFYGPYETMIAV